MVRARAAAPAAAPAPAPAPAAGTGALSGRVEITAGRGQTLASGEAANAVVYFRPAAGSHRAPPGRFSIVTRNKRFAPTTLVVPIGSTVVFPNQDEVLHNVFSESPGSEFDLGLYGEGETRDVVLQRPGAVLVFCNVHYSMYAAVVVVDTPFHARVEPDGRFRIDGVPDGPGTLHVWHPRADALARRIDSIGAGAGTLALEIVKPLIPEHQRLGGGSYAPTR